MTTKEASLERLEKAINKIERMESLNYVGVQRMIADEVLRIDGAAPRFESRKSVPQIYLDIDKYESEMRRAMEKRDYGNRAGALLDLKKIRDKYST